MSEPHPILMPLVSVPTSTTPFAEFYIHPSQDVAVKAERPQPDEVAVPMEVRRTEYFRIKSVVDWVITSALLILAVPIMALVATLILLLDGRPVFYRQRRVGKRGRDFWIWKFRTMRRDAESSTGAVWSNQSDPRVTPLGRWLRCSHLDELPQFINIMAGDMSLVGPRPERPEFVQSLTQELPHYANRTHVRPGITGLAQLRLGYDHSVSDVRKKLKLDLQYIRTASFSLDMWLLSTTLPYIARQLSRKWLAGRQSAGRSAKSTVLDHPAAALVAPTLRCDVPSNATADQTARHQRRDLAKHVEQVAADPDRQILIAKKLAS